MDKHYIYGLFAPDTNKLRYVGYSINPTRRYREHIHHTHQYVSKNNNWIISLKKNGYKPCLKIMEVCDTLEQGIQRESYWIRYFRKKGCKLNNHNDGGDGTIECSMTPKNRQRISNSVKKYYTDNPKADRLMRERFHKNCHKGRPMSDDNKQKLIDANIKPIRCNETNKIYKSLKDAAADLAIYSPNICKVLKGLRKTAGGYTFLYVT